MLLKQGGEWRNIYASPTATAPGVVFHGADGTISRPSGYAYIVWRGDAEPTNALADDIWIPDNLNSQHDHDLLYVNNGGGVPNFQADTRANQPAAGTAGRLFHVTDEQVIERDDGTSWNQAVDLSHRNDTANPHSVTAAQAGAANITGDTFTGDMNLDRGNGEHIRFNVDRWDDRLGLDIVGTEAGPHGRLNWRVSDQDSASIRFNSETQEIDLQKYDTRVSNSLFINNQIYLTDGDGNVHQVWASGSGTTRRINMQTTDANSVVRLFSSGYSKGFEARLDLGSGNENCLTIDNGDGHVRVYRDFTVNGAKNAEIIDPNDLTKGYRFAAVEADRPGVLEHEIMVEVNTTYSLPEYWSRIAKNLRVSLSPQDSQAGNAWPEIDEVNWTITPRGQPGKYWALIRADRADVGVEGWQHIVDIPVEEEELV